MFQLSLLGPFSLTDPDGEALEIASKKNRLMLALLASGASRSMSRDALAGLLWAESSDEQAKNSLRQALAVLRKELKGQDASIFAALGPTVAFHPDHIVVDTERFVQDIRLGTRESLERAVSLWRGRFLADVTASEPELDQWLAEQREHYSNQYIAAMDRLVLLLDGQARIEMARRLVQADNLREASHRHLMEAYSAAGERSQALRHYDKLRKLLWDELGVAPSPEIEELRRTIASNGHNGNGRHNGHNGNGRHNGHDGHAADVPPPAPPSAPASAPPAAVEPPPVAAAAAAKHVITRKPSRAALAVVAAAVFALVIGGAGWFLARPAPAPVTKPTVAVLPFESLSGGAEDERIAEALTVETITDLSRFWDLRVMAKDTVDVYRGKPVDIRALGAELKLSHVVKGTFQRDKDQVRVTAQLIDAATGATLWSDRFDRLAGEIFAIQSDVADHIANSLGGKEGKVGENILVNAKRKLPSDLGAYELYLLAQDTMHSDLTDAHMREGQKLLEQAIAKDPTLARAYVKHANAYAWRITYEPNAAALIQEMIKDARKGVELDPMDADAHAALGYSLTLSGDRAQGEAQFDEALRLTPNAFDLLAGYSCMAHNFGRADRGAESAERAIAINPNYPNWSIPCLRLAMFMVGRYEDALRIQSRQPESAMNSDGFVVMAASLAQLGKTEEAKAVVQHGMAKFPGLLSIERFALNRGWSPATSKVMAEQMRKAGFPVCANDQELAGTPNPVRLPECAHSG